MYEEPKFDAEGKFIKKIKTEEEINEKLQAPLKEGVLKVNCGLPLMFIVNKTDVITQSVDKKLYEENSEFILRHIRKTAISYGASIIYASGKSSCNLTLLYDYLCHCLFNFDMTHLPNLIDKEAYFIPTGYDSFELLQQSDPEKLLDILFEERIPYQKIQDTKVEEEETCEDTNTFFGNLKKEKDLNKMNKSHIANKEEIKTSINLANYGTEMPGNSRPSKLDNISSFSRFLKKKDDKKESKVIMPVKQEKEKDAAKFNKTKEEMLKKLGIVKHKKEGEEAK